MKTSYSPEFGKTVSAGISALVKGKQEYYILEHLVSSQYHQAGDEQEIMLDEVYLGRGSNCQVRFDDSFATVSHHHASIVRDGNNWRLVHISKVNNTYLNGKPVQESWYLQSGDEIQLAKNGPKLIFKIPTETTEFKFTQRLDSFKDQVIRPYRTAIIVICSVIVLLIAGGITAGAVIWKQQESLRKYEELIITLTAETDELTTRLDEEAAKANEAERKAINAQQAAFKAKKRAIQSEKNLQDVQEQMQQLRDEMNGFYNEIINAEKQY